jgi:16S rRNA (cytosine1402-N4)-methyltransferase
MHSGSSHQPVMRDEVIDALQIKPNGIYLDATFGRGGHSCAILSQLNDHGKLHVFDRDPEAIDAAKQLQKSDPRVIIHHARYSQITEKLPPCDHGKIDGILFDLGVSSNQLDTASRGFSFQKTGPLDMRMNPQDPQSAADWINSVPEETLYTTLKIYGEERFARPIAKAIIAQRNKTPLKSTQDLVDAVQTVCYRHQHKHPATRTFQAVRMIINQELSDLANALEQVPELLAPKGRIVILSFHSLEDRLVKQWMKGKSVTKKRIPFPELNTLQTACNLSVIKYQKKPTQQAIADNRRARSALLRVAEKQEP